ncbi:hypothetical protein SAMN04244575_06724 [Sinorhizobium meliloti]|nr:hypothetical protein SAMN04244575_06724 [Sinorhizobium meliloti]
MWSDRACSFYLSNCKNSITHRSVMTTPHNYRRRIVAHVRGSAGKIHSNTGSWSNHAASTARISRVRTLAFTPLSKQRLRPRGNRNSIIPDRSC